PELSPTSLRKSSLLARMSGSRGAAHAQTVLATYGGRGLGPISVPRLRHDVRAARTKKLEFERLGVRGFSYTLYEGIAGFPYRLRSAVNLRIALVADRTLFFPPAVGVWLRRSRFNHVFVAGDPAIAFLLGVERNDGWYVCTIQSDIAHRG